MPSSNEWFLSEYDNGIAVRTIKKGQGLPPISKELFENDYKIMRDFLEKRNHKF